VRAATTIHAVELLSLLSDGIRWQILSALAGSDRRVQDLARIVSRPMNQVSYHLKKLRDVKLVRERRSDADARDVYYSLDLDRLLLLYQSTGESLHPALVAPGPLAAETALSSRERPAVLFLCTENSARSQMAEGILRHMSRGQVEVASAGTKPTEVHQLAVQVLAEIGIDISGHRSKSLEEFLGQSFDYIITVCDRVKESCPSFPGNPERIHWSFGDPAAVEGSEQARHGAFKATANDLMTMIRYLLIIIERGRNRKRPVKEEYEP